MAEGTNPQGSNSATGGKNEEIDEALSIIGGATRFVRKVRHLRGSPELGTPSPATSAGKSSPLSKDALLPTPSISSPALFDGEMSSSSGNPVSTFGAHELESESLNMNSETLSQFLQRQVAQEGHQHERGGAPFLSNSEPAAWVSSSDSSQSPFVASGVPSANTSYTTPGFTPADPASTNSFLNAIDFNAEFPNFLAPTDLPMAIDDLNMNFDFDVGAGMSSFSDPATKSQLELQFSDSTIAQAWHSILEDPRFAGSGSGTGPF